MFSVLGLLLCCSNTKVVWPLEQRQARSGLTVTVVNFLLGTVNWCRAARENWLLWIGHAKEVITESQDPY